MLKYLTYLKNSFEPLKLNNEEELIDQRTSHPLELFFDLVFVVALGKLGHVFLHPEIKQVLMAIILYLTVFQIWKNITNFNAYFFKSSLLISFLFLLVMLPVFFIASISDYQDIKNIYLLVVSISISRLVLTFAWYKLVYKNKNIRNVYIKQLSKSYSVVFMVSAILMLLGLLNYRLFYVVLTITLCLEFFSISHILAKANKKFKKYRPKIDKKLLQERRVLFIILVWGEALVVVGSVFSNYDTFVHAVLMSLSLFFIIGLFFIRAIVALGDRYNYENMSPMEIELTDYIFPLISLSLFVSIAGIAISDSVYTMSRLIVFADLLYINGHHMILNIENIKTTNDENLLYFTKVDNKLLIVQLVITFCLLVIDNSSIFVYLILVIFFLHAVAVPIRYKQTELF